MTSFIEPDTAKLIVQLQIFAAQMISKASKQNSAKWEKRNKTAKSCVKFNTLKAKRRRRRKKFFKINITFENIHIKRLKHGLFYTL